MPLKYQAVAHKNQNMSHVKIVLRHLKLLKKSLMENLIFRAVKIINYTRNENLILSKNKNISSSRFQ